ncbi:hypothetical protein NUW58_g7071 [Xylaria curta]|uniref:Uncharacterized protein n=1 Tax=Xylaria curta TaxID=42375 RepID=A0ACC1NN64_9PEZI|nr:hypothetical protein NUW58_g7071 [Xylaria curta]
MASPTMATYQQLKRNPDSRVLFDNRITTMNDLYKLVDSNSAFMALDTEHVPVENETNRILHQVGLTYLPATSTAMMLNTSIPSRLRLSNFYDKYQLQSLTLNIELSDQLQEDLIRFRGNIPNRRPSRFGYERQINLDSLESAIIEFIQSCSNSNTDLVLVGFEMAAEWNYLSKNFPRAMPYFSSWIDLRDIGKDIASAKVLPGRVSMLQTFGYYWKDIKGSNRNGSADNAGDDTVSTLAMANAFFYSENRDKLRSRVARQNGGKTGSFSLDDKIALSQAMSTDEIKEKQRLREFKKTQSLESDIDSLGENFIGLC